MVVKGLKLEVYDLPDELIEEILSWLPANFLIPLKCVSKQWYRILTNCNNTLFINIHLQRSTKSNLYPHINNALFFWTRTSTHTSNVDAVLAGEQLSKHHYPPDIFDCDIVPTDYSVGKTEYMRFSESCHGLICIQYRKKFGQNFDHLVLYNPTTKDFRRLPSLSPPSTAPYTTTPCPLTGRCPIVWGQERFFGFGYDTISGDYRVIMIVKHTFSNKQWMNEMNMFSLKKNSWSQVQTSLPRLSGVVLVGALAKNALHWKLLKRHVIIGIDLHSGKHRELQGPSLENETLIPMVKLNGRLDGSLEYIVSSDLREFEIWIMKEYGVKESWNKWLRIQSPSIRRSLFISPIGVAATATATQTEFVAFLGKLGSIGQCKAVKLSSNNNNDQLPICITQLELSDTSELFNMISYVPSLVSLE